MCIRDRLKPYNRDPHSVIGSTSIGASIVGGVCNNSGGSLVQRGPAYTELALYARVDENGKLELINELGINLGDNPETILNNLQNKNYNDRDIIYNNKLASDDKYSFSNSIGKFIPNKILTYISITAIKPNINGDLFLL